MRLPAPCRALAAPLLFCALALPARADTASFTLTNSWQKIASAGASIDVQNNNGAGYAVLSTGASGAPSGVAGQVLGPGEHRLYALTADLYARGTVPVVVTSGVGAGSAASPTYTSDANNAPFADFATLTADDSAAHNVSAGRSVEVDCTVAGNISLKLANGRAKVLPVQVGFQTFPWAAVGLNATGTTATATVITWY
jgi:hypothetical protein